MSELDRHLADLQSGTLDSSGAFSIDALAAARKGQSRWEEPGLLVVKMIEAFVTLGCTSIDVKQSGDRLRMSAPHPNIGSLSRDSEHLALSQALEAASATADAFGLRVGREKWLAKNAEVRPEANHVVFWMSAWWCANLVELVLVRCSHSPVPICWNGVRLEYYRQGAFSVGPGYFWSHKPRFGELVRGGEKFGLLDKKRVLDPTAALWNCADNPVLLRRSLDGSPLVALIPAVLEGPSLLVPVRQGVSLRPVRLLPDFGCLVLANGDALSLDISGFQARSDEALQRVLEDAHEQLSQLAELSLNRLTMPDPTPTSTEEPQRTRWQRIRRYFADCLDTPPAQYPQVPIAGASDIQRLRALQAAPIPVGPVVFH
jgi:hypothetical protein